MNRKVVIGLIIGCCVIAALGMSFKSSDGLTTVEGALTVTGDVTIGGVTRSDWPASSGGGMTNFQILFTVDGGGSTVTTGLKKNFFYIDRPLTLRSWFLVADVSSSAVVDVYKTNFTAGASFLPSLANAITVSTNKPNVTSMVSSNFTVGGWTTSTLASNDVVYINVDSAVSPTYLRFWIEATSP